jgi:hypothetical protein
MNMMPLADRLESLGLGLKGTTLFIHMLPTETGNAILLRSPLSGTRINHELPGYYRSEFQLIVRTPAADYEAGQALVSQVVAALTLTDTQIGPQFFNYCRPRTQPITFPLSKGNLLEISLTFEVNFIEAA